MRGWYHASRRVGPSRQQACVYSKPAAFSRVPDENNRPKLPRQIPNSSGTGGNGALGALVGSTRNYANQECTIMHSNMTRFTHRDRARGSLMAG